MNVAKNELGKKKRFGGFIEIWAVGGLSADQTEISQLLYESEKERPMAWEIVRKGRFFVLHCRVKNVTIR